MSSLPHAAYGSPEHRISEAQGRQLRVEEVWASLQHPPLLKHAAQLSVCIDQIHSNIPKIDKALAERDDNARRALLSEEDQIRELQDDILALSDDAVIADEFLSETADLIMALEDSALDAARELEDRQQQQQPTSDAHASAKRVFDALSTASRRAQETDAEGRRFLAGYVARHYAELMRQLNPNANPSPRAPSAAPVGPAPHNPLLHRGRTARNVVLSRHLSDRGREERRSLTTRRSYLNQEHRSDHLDANALGKGGAQEGGYRRALVYFGRGY